MKKEFIIIIIVSFFVVTCEPYDRNAGEYIPIYMSRDVLENSVKYIAGEREMIETGKIYYRYPYIFINERYKGVHVINNTDPYNPVKEGFILAPGCIDMAVKGNIIYLDNAVDLVSFDLNTKEVTSRIRNVFPEPTPSGDIFRYRKEDRPKGSIIVRWDKVEKTNKD